MSKAELVSSFATRRSRQRGQAYAEYLVVTTVLVGALVVADSNAIAPVAALLSSFKSFFSAYSFTLSLP
ncbi:putative membrane protein [Paraburkholderia xenovorans LB400]|uniref:Flp/Fap pilin component n=1 Tax=Paraburkholderia xenovorans (strain LB400) TaxID=266265 RepID=Q13S62_PARXL|nr:hypothetical protein [Paraburkholderia xenovorans]ABE33077.1 hypothetical protein Bxe_B2918 [Paraburkholderia xenovorans LB400]AIP35551.1 putative membrane protein [Paraburkholderia xenovorans LB400]